MSRLDVRPMPLRLFPLVLAPLAAQDPAQIGPQDRAVLRQEGREYTARQVLERIAAWDGSLKPTLDADPEYLRLYLDSPRFAAQVRAFSDALLVEADGLAEASPEALRAEALAWAADRGLRADAAAALARAGIEIEMRARLISGQPEAFGTQELRQHMLRSVPEFFGELQVSWIRAPLVEIASGRAFGDERRRAVYDRLDGVGARLLSGELAWEKAVEECAADPELQARGGPVGILRRTMTDRYEEELLRPLFEDLGFRRPEGPLLRGPILTAQWAYLARIEAMVVPDVPDLERARARIERSLRERLLRQHLAELAAGTDRRVLLPLPG